MSAIIFVYNADSGLLNALTDTAHKLLAPETYQCRLSTITGTALGPKRRWREFVCSLGRAVEFLHRNELRRAYAIDGIPLPAMFLRDKGELHLALAADAINRCRSIDELEELVQSFVHDH